MPDIKISSFDWLLDVNYTTRKNDAITLKKLIAFEVIELVHSKEIAIEFKNNLTIAKALSFDFATEHTISFNNYSDITLFTVMKFLKDKTNLKISDMIKANQVKINEQTINFDFIFNDLNETYNIQLGKKVFIKLKFQQEI